jgi:hypothetical protein
VDLSAIIVVITLTALAFGAIVALEIYSRRTVTSRDKKSDGNDRAGVEQTK